MRQFLVPMVAVARSRPAISKWLLAADKQRCRAQPLPASQSVAIPTHLAYHSTLPKNQWDQKLLRLNPLLIQFMIPMEMWWYPLALPANITLIEAGTSIIGETVKY